jgi:hypothetical protein
VFLKNEPISSEPSGAPNSVSSLYGTSPRKYFPPRTLPVIIKLPVVSTGFGVLTSPLLTLLGGTVGSPIASSNAKHLAQKIVKTKTIKNPNIEYRNSKQIQNLNASKLKTF